MALACADKEEGGGAGVKFANRVTYEQKSPKIRKKLFKFVFTLVVILLYCILLGKTELTKGHHLQSIFARKLILFLSTKLHKYCC
jgi:hypothetical protein